LGFRVQGLGLRVQGSGFSIQGSSFRVQGEGFRVKDAGCRVQGAGCRVQGAGFREQGSGFRVQGSGFRVQVQGSGSAAEQRGNNSNGVKYFELKMAQDMARIWPSLAYLFQVLPTAVRVQGSGFGSETGQFNVLSARDPFQIGRHALLRLNQV